VTGVNGRAAVLGHPVAHSLSPSLHRAAYAALGLTGWRYDVVDVDEQALPAFVEGLDASWAGLSLTMPLKRAIRPLLAVESELARAVGAVNTVTFTPGGLVGDNTDVYGIVTALSEAGRRRVSSAAILGGGATASSALAALSELGCSAPTVHLRRPAAAGDLLDAAQRLGAAPVLRGLDAAALVPSGGVDVVVSTLPGGAADDRAAEITRLLCVPGRGGALPLLFDVVYAPWPSRLAQEWAALGGPVVGGFEMLLHQAVEQVRLMTGLPGPVDAMRAGGLAELASRERATPVG
jgi:shikimate dehydrogenase